MKIDDNFFMQLAIDEGWKNQLLTYPNPAVGAVIVDENNNILSIESHKEAGKPHAEVLAIQKAYLNKYSNNRLKSLINSIEIHKFLYQNHNNFFQNCKIYVTLEPCNHYGKTPPCSLLISKLKFKEVIISVKDKYSKGGIEFLRKNNILVKTGILQKNGKKLLYPFLTWQKSGLKFFKLAQRLNGSIDGGYITSKKSLKFVHKLRDKIELLTIGGNTVRTDKPTLDTRFIKNGDNPDILIFSKNPNLINKDIPLFKIKNRKVYIKNNLKKLENSKFSMIEGGFGMMDFTKDIVDLYLIFISPSILNGLNLTTKLNLDILYLNKIGKDILIWAKPKKI